MDIQLIQTVGPIIVLALLIIFLIVKSLMNKEGKADVEKFLKSISDMIEGVILNYLDDIDFTTFHNLADIEKKILDEIYDQIWTLTIAALENSSQSALVKMLIKKYLTRETVEAFIKYIFSEEKVQTIYTNKYNNALLSNYRVKMSVEDIENLEAETVAENEKYEKEEISEEDVPAWAEKLLDDYPDGTSENPINPAVDADDISVAANDTSVEEV